MPIDPATLRIVHYPAPVLLKKAKPVPEINEEVAEVAERMLELMRDAEGIGLAAPQVGLPWRMFVVDIPESDERSAEASEQSPYPTATDGPEVYINPVFSNAQGAIVAMEEGCLSLPEIRGEVMRQPVITITAQDLSGKTFTQTGSGLLARCWQHEMDHLDGILIISRMSQMSRIKNKQAIRELERSA
jgi:peptide deformylase